MNKGVATACVLGVLRKRRRRGRTRDQGPGEGPRCGGGRDQKDRGIKRLVLSRRAGDTKAYLLAASLAALAALFSFERTLA